MVIWQSFLRLHSAPRDGYILLIAVLFTGMIAFTVLTSVLLLGAEAGHVTISTTRAAQALAAAQGCAEYALQELRNSPEYGGNEILTLGRGECALLPIGGTGNFNRLICIQGQTGDATRRLEIVVKQLLPQTSIYSWQEVPEFTLCE